jgi:hypothetical protein
MKPISEVAGKEEAKRMHQPEPDDGNDGHDFKDLL